MHHHQISSSININSTRYVRDSLVRRIYDDRKQRHRPHHPYACRESQARDPFFGQTFSAAEKNIEALSPYNSGAPDIFLGGAVFYTKKIRYPKDTRIQKIRGSERYLPWLPRYFSGGTKDKIYTNITQKILRGSKIKYIRRYGPGVHWQDKRMMKRFFLNNTRRWDLEKKQNRSLNKLDIRIPQQGLILLSSCCAKKRLHCNSQHDTRVSHTGRERGV